MSKFVLKVPKFIEATRLDGSVAVLAHEYRLKVKRKNGAWIIKCQGERFEFPQGESLNAAMSHVLLMLD